MQIIRPFGLNTVTTTSRELVDGFSLVLDIYTEGNRSVTQELAAFQSYANGLITFPLNLTVTEGNFYFIIGSQNNKELFKLKCFCTSETDYQNYSITNGEFITPTQSNNDFIVI